MTFKNREGVSRVRPWYIARYSEVRPFADLGVGCLMLRLLSVPKFSNLIVLPSNVSDQNGSVPRHCLAVVASALAVCAAVAAVAASIAAADAIVLRFRQALINISPSPNCLCIEIPAFAFAALQLVLFGWVRNKEMVRLHKLPRKMRFFLGDRKCKRLLLRKYL